MLNKTTGTLCLHLRINNRNCESVRSALLILEFMTMIVGWLITLEGNFILDSFPFEKNWTNSRRSLQKNGKRGFLTMPKDEIDVVTIEAEIVVTDMTEVVIMTVDDEADPENEVTDGTTDVTEETTETVVGLLTEEDVTTTIDANLETVTSFLLQSSSSSPLLFQHY